ncbi:MAG TPA: (2Fe-2S)-binding protein [Streptosporangiaceae bacterium]|nr:(2Fe-2S)-binding protein [Streptosporangiaceae bacterium]
MTDNADGSIAVPVTITVNGRDHSRLIEPWRSLADVLRRDLGLTGTRVACDLGACGTCTVLVNGDPVRACLLLAVQADGQRVETVESLTAADGTLGGLQQAFSERHALQCGFCTPGFLMLGTALLRATGAPSREQVRECVSANLCRCTGYGAIIDAIELAAAGSQE